MTIKEIDQEIEKLKAQKKEIEKNELENYFKNAKENIGRCFIFDEHTYAIILDTPQEKWNNSLHRYYDKYWYPALFLCINRTIDQYVKLEISPIYIDEVFIDKDIIHTHDHDSYEEISKEEFLKIMKNDINSLSDKIIQKTNR